MEDEASDKDIPSSSSSSSAAAVTGAGSDDEGRNEERRLSGAGGRRPSLPVPLHFPFASAFSSGNPFMTGARTNPFASPEEMGEDGEEIEHEDEEEEEMGDVNVLQTRASRLDWFPPELIPQLPENPMACALFEAAEGHISSLKSIISSHKVQAQQHEREIENIIEETITSTSRYESQFQSLRRQHDDLMLQMVKLNTELEAYKSGERAAQRQGMGDGNEESNNSQPFYLNHPPSSSSSPFPSTPIPSSSPPFSSSSSSSAAPSTDAGLSTSEPDDVFGRITKLMIELEKKMALTSDQSSVRKRLPLLIEFLTHLHNDKSRERQTIDKQITQLDRDLKALKEYQDTLPKETEGHSSSLASGEAMSTSNGDKSPTRRRSPKASSRIRAEIALEGSLSDSDSVLKRRGRDDDDEPVENRQRKKQKVMAHFNELRDIYFNQMPSQDQKRIDEFCSELEKASQYDDLKALRTFNYRSFSANPRTSNHVCKIEIDQNQNFLSVAGSLNLIQIFDYKSQICPDTASSSSMFSGDVEDPISPVQQLHYDSDHHLTSTAWATNVNGKIVSTDVQGRVHLWNVETGDLERSFEGHDGTGYQVKCNRNSAIGLFGSASADKTVRLWDPSTNRPPIKIVESSECLSLAFDPLNEFLLYVACADSRIVFYDYRNIRSSLFTLTGHSNIVHNVQFDHSNNLFSMSNDSTVQMWSPSSNFGQYQIDGAPLSFSQYESRRTFKGHKNPKYAAAMATSRDLLACGSEDNNLVIYSKSSSYPILNHSFNTGLFTQDYNQYITDICWDHSELNLVGANSKGIIKVFQLTKIADDDDDDDSASNDSKMG